MTTLKFTPVCRLILIAGFMAFLSCGKSEPDNEWLSRAVSTAQNQLKLAADNYSPGQNPRSINPAGDTRIAPPRDWTCGFFPGSLWYMYELTGDGTLKHEADRYTRGLNAVQYFTHTHDLGFMLYCSYGNGYRITGNKEYEQVLIKGASSLAGRYNPIVGCIRSWDFGDWQFPVIVDNMMNLEFLCWASKKTNDKQYMQMAISHANKTKENHFRKNYSSYHVVSYDTITGNVLQKQTHQGYSDESSWARGQAWGVYGYTMMYRETGKKEYLQQAQNIAALIMNLKNMPKDKIPYWDYDAPSIPNSPRDASAAAITASALIELSAYVDHGEKYFSYAEDILKSLSSDKYLAKAGTNNFFILKHSVGAYPNNSEIDTPINYADYYYLEALLRYKKYLKRA